MYFSKIQMNQKIKPDYFLRKADVYDHHQFIWSFFNTSSSDKNCFLYRIEDNNQDYCFYTASKNPPISISSSWHVEIKNYQPKIQKGEKLQFELRLNPVFNQCTSNRRGKRHDLIMDMKKKYHEQNQQVPLSNLIQQAGKKWLGDRCSKFGFLFEEENFIAERYQIHRFFKKQGHKEQISFSSLDLRGILTVTDESLFYQSLFQGIGPAKRFGCGLLMVKRMNQ